MLTVFNRSARLKTSHATDEQIGTPSRTANGSPSMNDASKPAKMPEINPSKRSGGKAKIWTKQYWQIEAVKMTALWLLLSPLVAMPFYTHIIFFPDKTDYSKDVAAPLAQLRQENKVTAEDVYFKTTDGQRLHGMYFAYPGTKKVVLVCHGNAGNIAHRVVLAQALIVSKVNVLLFDYQGYGSSEGSPSIKGIVSDSVAAYDYLHKERHVDPTNLVVYGESIGSGAAAQLAQQRPVGGIIIQSGFSSLVSAGKDHIFFLNFYPDSWFPENLDNVAAFQKPHAPLLIIHGKEDHVLAFHNAEKLYAGACEPKRLVAVDKLGHSVERSDMKEFSEPITKFLQTLPTD